MNWWQTGFGFREDILSLREWVNGLWFSLSFCVTVVIGRRLIQGLQDSVSVRAWVREPTNRVVVPLFGYFLAETMMRGWVWMLLTWQNNHWEYQWIEAKFPIAFIAAFLAVWSCLCCIYAFTQTKWAWILCCCVIVLFILFETFAI